MNANGPRLRWYFYEKACFTLHYCLLMICAKTAYLDFAKCEKLLKPFSIKRTPYVRMRQPSESVFLHILHNSCVIFEKHSLTKKYTMNITDVY